NYEIPVFTGRVRGCSSFINVNSAISKQKPKSPLSYMQRTYGNNQLLNSSLFTNSIRYGGIAVSIDHNNTPFVLVNTAICLFEQQTKTVVSFIKYALPILSL